MQALQLLQHTPGLFAALRVTLAPSTRSVATSAAAPDTAAAAPGAPPATYPVVPPPELDGDVALQRKRLQHLLKIAVATLQLQGASVSDTTLERWLQFLSFPGALQATPLVMSAMHTDATSAICALLRTAQANTTLDVTTLLPAWAVLCATVVGPAHARGSGAAALQPCLLLQDKALRDVYLCTSAAVLQRAASSVNELRASGAALEAFASAVWPWTQSVHLADLMVAQHDALRCDAAGEAQDGFGALVLTFSGLLLVRCCLMVLT